MNTQLKKAAKLLNLQSHICGIRSDCTEELSTATDLEGHIGLVHFFENIFRGTINKKIFRKKLTCFKGRKIVHY